MTTATAEALDYDEAPAVHITHVFSTFTAKNTSDTYAEMNLVQQSWQAAAQFAQKTRDIKVEFIDATLPVDDASVPLWARGARLQRYLDDVVKGRIATVGEPFERGVELGRGQYMIVTNADIGAMEDFYVRVWDWASTDYRTSEAQLKAITDTAAFLAVCFPFENDEGGSAHRVLCREDAKVVFTNRGGMPALWDEAREAVGMLALRRIAAKDDGGFSHSQARALMELMAKESRALGTASEWKARVAQYEPAVKPRLDLAKPMFAGTVTRLDTPLPDNAGPLAKFLAKTGGMHGFRELARKTGEKHPGNDCFVMSRLLVPPGLMRMSQPQGVRPFGFWVVYALKRTGVPFRRVSSTREEPWTFHTGIGLWGGANIPWLDRANAQPKFTLFLSSNWDRVSGGLFKSQFLDAPAICKASTWPWRNIKFCSAVPHYFCNGYMRYACADYLHFELRDSMWYLQSCAKLFAVSKAVREPICSFCNFFFEHDRTGATSSKAKLACLPGELPYCKNLAEACMALPVS